ncbi:MAG: hypothetical protein A2V85_16960 [Chloroflexi bacterium RBG_16_72_14]|nr:MAG: hypothetical protein A2V85_16960 [Chloroflexi bacterium RBG_16_72_14]
MLLRVLGPLEVAGADRPVTLGAAKPRALLAALAIRRGTTCTTDALIDALWGESPPASASKLLQVYVSQLRKVLPAAMRIVTGATGYALEMEPVDIDAVRFERLLTDGRAARRAGNPALAAALLARGLALWRGPAYADVRYEPFAAEEVVRLERLRDLAFEDRVDADLQLGRHADVLGELRGLLATDPTREGIAARAMLAAYRAGRTAEALAVFATVGDAVRHELGEEPGHELRELRDRIIRNDPALTLDAADPAAPGAGALPAAPNPLIGRGRELAELGALVARPGVRLVSLTGAGGTGKSRVALELARALAPSFANGAVLIELASLHDPELVPATIARGLGLDPGRDAMATLLDALADREVLLVLDNVEHLRAATPDLVRLLAGAPRLVIVVTTRVVLHLSGEHVYPVTPLAERDAIALFAERAQAHDPSFALDATTERMVAAICRRLDGLPLAIELAAARVRALGLRALDARLASRLTILTGGPRDLPARQQTLRETLAWSANLLEPAQADVFAALAVFAGSFSMEAGEAVAGADDDIMSALVDHNLVQAFDLTGERRFRLLETVREYAYELLGSRREAVESALTTWVVEVVDAAALNGIGPPQVASLRRLDRELDNLRDAFRHASRDPEPSRELSLAAGTWRYWWVRGQLAEGRAIFDGTLDRRGLVPTQAGIRTARAAASLAWSMGDTGGAEALAREALARAVGIGDVIEQLSAHNLLGVIVTNLGEYEAAEHHLGESIRLAESDGNLELANTARLNLGVTYLEAGRIDDARAQFQAVLDYRQPEGLSEGVGFAHLNLGETEYDAGDFAAAEAHFAAASEAFGAVGFKVRLANALQGMAAVEARTGRAESAARRLGGAASLMAETGWGADGSALEPAATSFARAALGDEAFDRLFSEGAGAATGQ